MAEKTHFDRSKKRYETQGVNTSLDILYRFFMWQLIDELAENMQLDYLQVFEFKSRKVDNENNPYEMTLTHSQEVPEYSKTYTFPVSEPVNEKVFVIDDGDYATMLFASEYQEGGMILQYLIAGMISGVICVSIAEVIFA